MRALLPFQKLKKSLSDKKFYKHCKTIVLEKDNYAKIVVQKAQQFIDNYNPQKKSVAATTDF